MAMEASLVKSEKSAESICRLCLTEREYYQPIFENDHDSLPNWIENLTSLKIVSHPNAPASLCLECKSVLKNFESFREMCTTNDIVYQKLYLQGDQASSLEKLPVKSYNKDDYNECEDSTTEMVDFTSTEFLDDETEISVEYQDIKEEIDLQSSSNEELGEPAEHKVFIKIRKKTEIKKQLCPICNTYVSALKSHLRTHRDYKPFQCEYCSRTFNLMCNLNKHIRRHLQLKTFICSYCQKGFTNSGELNVHERIHTKVKPYQCKECDKSFRTGGCLNRHVQTIHQDLRPHTCEVCQTKFRLAAHLRRHMLRHTMERPYGCSVCNRKYARLDLLKVHSCRP